MSCRLRGISRGSGSRCWRRGAPPPICGAHGLDPAIVYKVNEGRPHIGDRLLNREIDLVINTPLGRESFFDDRTPPPHRDRAGGSLRHHPHRRGGRGQRDPGPSRTKGSKYSRCRTTTPRSPARSPKPRAGVPGRASPSRPTWRAARPAAPLAAHLLDSAAPSAAHAPGQPFCLTPPVSGGGNCCDVVGGTAVQILLPERVGRGGPPAAGPR